MHQDRRPWTKEELETLERLLGKVSAATIAKRLNRTARMEEWMPAMQKLLKLPLTIYAYFNNHYAEFGPASARAFNEMLNRMIGKRNAEINRPAPAQQTTLF